MDDNKLHKIRVIVKDTETGETMVDRTNETVFLIMSNYEDRIKNGKVSVLKYTNGSNVGIAEAIVKAGALSIAKGAVMMGALWGEK